MQQFADVGDKKANVRIITTLPNLKKLIAQNIESIIGLSL